ncbi:HAD-IIIC family phosphatase [Dactylosporangium aurantiacum]|uniref:HAD-IIIC family phosphatase n=1 Tax=Dactylosporangium aurantiacum TaxID=35754 RepID=A0A9Q9IT22_9ACTN|nr:HAD-IIIC family phosphatase [Dactylosporangium aurantiacum]MDG6109122.1 HAD-IIIC family phosphatase [Dactylosporangium aurantiacum]UWZ58453.1 HAD-IIIC family phosphatase [Dactylosporangium aurantiacum]
MAVDVDVQPVPAAGAPLGGVAQLRALKRTGGLGAAAAELRQVLAGLTDPLDLEAAGGLLSGVRAHAQLAAEGGFVPQRVALLGNSTLDALPNLLTATLVRDGLLPQVRLAGFDQWRLEILTGAPNLADLEPRVTACLLDDNAVFERVTDPLDPAQVERGCAAFPADLAAWAAACRQALGGLVVLATVPLSGLRRDRYRDYATRARVEAAWERMNAAILDLGTEQGTVVLSAAAIAARFGTAATGGVPGSIFGAERMRHVAGQTFSTAFLAGYAEELARVARADLGRSAKCLVLDLDNTLWGGVVGDDGPGGIKLGGAYPGSAHRELQDLAHDLMRQGVLLTVASKNDDATAREAIDTHPEMVLRGDAFVAFAADWNPKPGNVTAMAQQLNIGSDAMVFLDDNPAERDLMRRAAPQVTTVEVGADPAGYATLLAARGDFALLRVTEEDRGRTAMYRADAQRAELSRTAVDLEQYLVDLGSKLSVERLAPLNAARITQLFGKTNQFNLTGRRYGDDEVRRREHERTAAYFGARLADRFGDHGLIAAVALARSDDGAWEIENMVLSCRVFSRNVEDALVGLILRAALAAGAPAVRGGFVASPKNGKFAGFYPGLGFAPVGGAPGRYQHDLRELPTLPRWIQITPDEEVFHVH